MTLTIDLFAQLGDDAGQSRLRADFPDGLNAGAVYDLLALSYPLSLSRAQVRPALNDEFTDWDAPLADGDRLALLPPVSGG